VAQLVEVLRYKSEGREFHSRLLEFFIDTIFLTLGSTHPLTETSTRDLSLMFVPCIIRRSRHNQHYALNYTTPLFNIQTPTYFGSSLPSSGSFLDPSELLEMQIE
jgi:hypothetical protein